MAAADDDTRGQKWTRRLSTSQPQGDRKSWTDVEAERLAKSAKVNFYKPGQPLTYTNRLARISATYDDALENMVRQGYYDVYVDVPGTIAMENAIFVGNTRDFRLWGLPALHARIQQILLPIVRRREQVRQALAPLLVSDVVNFGILPHVIDYKRKVRFPTQEGMAAMGYHRRRRPSIYTT